MNISQLHLDVPHEKIASFARQLDGQLIRPTDPDYHEARRVWNGMIDKYPALIARCHGTQDVVAAVNFARENEVPVSVRGGGHNVAGTAIRDNGLVIDLSDMRGVEVDPAARRARAQGGALWADVDAATQPHGLAAPGGLVSETGIAGLTLGGGFGWLRNKYGLSCDNLLSAEVVLSDGRVVRASQDEHPDLLWALRGGGGQFGVVTEFEYQLHPVGPEVYFAFMMQPGGDKAAAALRWFRDFIAGAPDEVTTLAALGFVPEEEEFPAAVQGEPFVLFSALYAGDPAAGEKILRPLREYDTPLVDISGVMPYVEAQQVFDEDYPRHDLHYYWKSAFVGELSDTLIERLVSLAMEMPSKISTIDIWATGAAVQRVSQQDSAYANRHAPFMINTEANWADAADDDANIAWARAVDRAVANFSDGTAYLNFPGFYEDGEQSVQAMLGANHPRIAEVKAKYDPPGIFSIH